MVSLCAEQLQELKMLNMLFCTHLVSDDHRAPLSYGWVCELQAMQCSQGHASTSLYMDAVMLSAQSERLAPHNYHGAGCMTSWYGAALQLCMYESMQTESM